MKKRTFHETVRTLCASRDEFKFKEGGLNVGGAARLMGLNQPTLKRIIDGASGNPKPETVDKICRYFRLSIDQVMGKKPIPGIDVDAKQSDSKEVIEEINSSLESATPEFIQEVRDYIRFRNPR